MKLLQPLKETNVPGFGMRRGKVCDVYEVDGGEILLLRSDRISARDRVFPNPVPGKGLELNLDTAFWLNELGGVATPHHMVTIDPIHCPPEFRRPEFMGRLMLCRKSCGEVMVEAIPRGRNYGSFHKEYEEACKVPGTADVEVHGHRVPRGMKMGEKFPIPLITFSTKAQGGAHDENISFAQVCNILGQKRAEDVRDRTRAIWAQMVLAAKSRRIIGVDTKMEFGIDAEGRVMLVDELGNVDASRWTPEEGFQVGELITGWSKEPPRRFLDTEEKAGRWDGTQENCPALPDAIVEQMAEIHASFHERLTGHSYRA